jgi:hypothetical protein
MGLERPVRRAVIAAAIAAVLAVTAGPGTFAGTFSATRANTASVSTQTVFPALNTAVPVVTVTGGGLTRTATLGTWITPNVATTSYELRWERCTGVGVCSDIGEATTGITSLATTTVHVVVGADAGTTMRVKVIGTNSAAAPVASTVAYSTQVS